jgi:hypothetical protein
VSAFHPNLSSGFDPFLPLALHPLRRIDDRKIFELNAERQWISAWPFGGRSQIAATGIGKT